MTQPAQSPLAPPASERVEANAQVVAEVADQGVEGGVGAHVEHDQPWDGYAKLKATQVTSRLNDQSDAALSMVLLYERSHRARRSVLEAARRELARRRAAPPVPAPSPPSRATPSTP